MYKVSLLTAHSSQLSPWSPNTSVCCGLDESQLLRQRLDKLASLQALRDYVAVMPSSQVTVKGESHTVLHHNSCLKKIRFFPSLLDPAETSAVDLPTVGHSRPPCKSAGGSGEAALTPRSGSSHIFSPGLTCLCISESFLCSRPSIKMKVQDEILSFVRMTTLMNNAEDR